LSSAFLGIDSREMKSESGFSFAIASQPLQMGTNSSVADTSAHFFCQHNQMMPPHTFCHPVYHTKKPEKDIVTKLDTNHFFIAIRVYIYHFQGLGPILNFKNVFCFLDTEG